MLAMCGSWGDSTGSERFLNQGLSKRARLLWCQPNPVHGPIECNDDGLALYGKSKLKLSVVALV